MVSVDMDKVADYTIGPGPLYSHDVKTGVRRMAFKLIWSSNGRTRYGDR
jgi:hypothetical protein